MNEIEQAIDVLELRAVQRGLYQNNEAREQMIAARAAVRAQLAVMARRLAGLEGVADAAFAIMADRIDPHATGESATQTDEQLIMALIALDPERMRVISEGAKR